MRLISMDKLIDYCVKHRCGSVPIDFIKADKPIISTLKINVWLYDPNGTCCRSVYIMVDSIEQLLNELERLSENEYYTYIIYNGSNSAARPKK